MFTIQQIDTTSKSQVNEFIQFHYKLYAGTPQWVPPFISDIQAMLNRNKHPFYEHSEAEFFVAKDRKGEVVGRIGLLENKAFNRYHDTRNANFYLFDVVDDLDAAKYLFDAVFEWCKKRNLNKIVGPKGFSLFDGYGIQIEGNDQRQMMTMMNYNFPYYGKFMEQLGFEKEVDFVSCYLPAESFRIPERVERIAKRVMERGKLKIKDFKSKKGLIQWAQRIGEAYNKAFVNNWEYYPLSQGDIEYAKNNIFMVADHRLIKLILSGEEIVGFLFAFPDASSALQRAKGRLFPFGIVDILLEMKRTKTVSGNGMGVLPEFQGMGGNALLYYELGKTILENYNFKFVEMTQVAETTHQMRADLKNLHGVEYKNHRVYRKAIG